MGTLLFFFVLFTILAVAARYWGFDSSETINSCEWALRKNWHNTDGDAVVPCSTYNV